MSDDAADTVIDPDSWADVVVVEELEVPQPTETTATAPNTIPAMALEPHRLRRTGAVMRRVTSIITRWT